MLSKPEPTVSFENFPINLRFWNCKDGLVKTQALLFVGETESRGGSERETETEDLKVALH